MGIFGVDGIKSGTGRGGLCDTVTSGMLSSNDGSDTREFRWLFEMGIIPFGKPNIRDPRLRCRSGLFGDRGDT